MNVTFKKLFQILNKNISYRFKQENYLCKYDTGLDNLQDIISIVDS